ncbi:MAG: hypothetical protein M0C28_24365 [Candidatus Moduliflexus flocculans]|nr:hypothetical protein [Candidatus Moduliflexus flocculans]
MFGDSSLKVFGSVRHLLRRHEARTWPKAPTAASSWISNYYDLDDHRLGPDRRQRQLRRPASQAGGTTSARDWRIPSFDTRPIPTCKPIVPARDLLRRSRRRSTEEPVLLGAPASTRNCCRTIEDIGILDARGRDQYFIANPGSDYVETQYHIAIENGSPARRAPGPRPKATRDYYGGEPLPREALQQQLVRAASTTPGARSTGNYSVGPAPAPTNGRGSPRARTSSSIMTTGS